MFFFESGFLENHRVVTCFVATCLVSLILLLSFLPRWFRNQAQPVPIHGAVHGLAQWLGRGPLTSCDPNSLIEISNGVSAPTFVSVPTIVASDITEIIEAGRWTFTTVHERARSKCKSLPCLCVFQQATAAANSSKRQLTAAANFITCRKFLANVHHWKLPETATK